MKDPSDWTLEKKVKSYQRSLEKHGVGFKAMQWRSEKAARLRYQQLIADIDFINKSVLDVGCGFGDIVNYITDKTRSFSYTGVDIVPEFINTARKKYPKHKFVHRNYFDKPLKQKFDIVISSGALNSNMKDPISFRKKAIKTMSDHTKEIKNKKSNRVWYADSLEVLQHCMSLTGRVIFRNQYHKKDFTILIFKD
jgi:2-polyprenyl-3-methyl-5-hydroxy-6-metoxy-1,4-benzoquinol methylase